jgi:hypothetical protein
VKVIGGYRHGDTSTFVRLDWPGLCRACAVPAREPTLGRTCSGVGYSPPRCDYRPAPGRIEEALAYAEASRGLNQPDRSIDAACERILLGAGRADEAYERYALTASETATGLAAFRAIAKKYPHRDPSGILVDLAESCGDTGRYFAAAKDAGFYDLALKFAGEGRTDPRTLSRASRDLAGKEPMFAMAVGPLALERLLQDHGYEITSLDVLDAYKDIHRRR